MGWKACFKRVCRVLGEPDLSIGLVPAFGFGMWTQSTRGYERKCSAFKWVFADCRRFFFDSTEMTLGKEDANKRCQVTGEEAIANIPVAILTFEFDVPNALLCYFAGCMRWASRFGSQMFLSSCLDSLEAMS